MIFSISKENPFLEEQPCFFHEGEQEFIALIHDGDIPGRVITDDLRWASDKVHIQWFQDKTSFKGFRNLQNLIIKAVRDNRLFFPLTASAVGVSGDGVRMLSKLGYKPDKNGSGYWLAKFSTPEDLLSRHLIDQHILHEIRSVKRSVPLKVTTGDITVDKISIQKFFHTQQSGTEVIDRKHLRVAYLQTGFEKYRVSLNAIRVTMKNGVLAKKVEMTVSASTHVFWDLFPPTFLDLRDIGRKVEREILIPTFLAQRCLLEKTC
ncbi:hypothetical protein BAE30_14130 [Acidithiobacillus caldus]|uniref:Uncharacterized protein n=1 Tax=Acidithiobacillus caldus TaxID=33059 RepID=A0A1E7YSE4_9PROT|nr:hypothetical protein BAE30_14130 [Acidithiobacillus caldus]